MKATILRTMKSWSPKVKKAKTTKNSIVIGATPKVKNYVDWMAENNDV